MYKKGESWHYDVDQEDERMDDNLLKSLLVKASRLKKLKNILDED
jgi:hypothetical protein